MKHSHLIVLAAIALGACTKPETPTAVEAPAPVVQIAPAASAAPRQQAIAPKDNPTSAASVLAATPATNPTAAPQAETKAVESPDQCEAIATSKEGRAAVMQFAENDLKEIIARKAMETFPVPARLQITGLLSSGEVKASENYELVYTPAAAELVRTTDKGIICRVSTEFHADGTIAYTGEGNDGTTKVKEAPAWLDAKRDLYLKTTKRLDGGTQIQVVAL